MVNYAFIDENDIILSILYFEEEPLNIQEFIDSQNIVFNNKIKYTKKISESDKFWGVGMKINNEIIKPQKYYDSWIWDDMLDIWVSPVPHPSVLNSDDTNYYIWNEKEMKWNLKQ